MRSAKNRTRLVLAMAAAVAVIGLTGTAASAAEPIRIGEINSYTTLADFTQPYKKGWEMAVEEINAAGGVIGRPLEVVARDDGGKPDNAGTQDNPVNRDRALVFTYEAIEESFHYITCFALLFRDFQEIGGRMWHQ